MRRCEDERREHLLGFLFHGVHTRSELNMEKRKRQKCNLPGSATLVWRHHLSKNPKKSKLVSLGVAREHHALNGFQWLKSLLKKNHLKLEVTDPELVGFQDSKR